MSRRTPTWNCIVQDKACEAADKHTGTEEDLDDLVHRAIAWNQERHENTTNALCGSTPLTKW